MTIRAGIGFRKDFAEEFLSGSVLKPGFVELAPENWMNIGGFWKKKLNQLAENVSDYQPWSFFIHWES